MFDDETRAFLPQWKKMKDAQWERFQGTIPGLQLVKSGEGQHQYMLVRSIDPKPEDDEPGFYEGVIVGQLPQILMKVQGPRSRIGGKSVRRPAAEHEKPFTLRAIDLSDYEIDLILQQWEKGRSALDLPFVAAVYGRDGKARTR